MVLTMAELKDRMQSDLTGAIRSRNEVVAATLRMALTAVRSAEVAGEVARTLEDDEVLAVLGKEAKKRREAATAFADAHRPEKAERELAELAVLETYLPQQLTDDDLAALVDAAVAEVAAAGASGIAAMGRVMKLLQPQVAGRAEGGRVAAEVKRRLAAG
jgi:uncharacterized protein YqeY